MENKKEYTVLLTIFTYGSKAITCEREKVREQCEKLKKVAKIATGNIYQRIEVINNNTGEIREYWNNQDNTIQF